MTHAQARKHTHARTHARTQMDAAALQGVGQPHTPAMAVGYALMTVLAAAGMVATMWAVSVHDEMSKVRPQRETSNKI